MAEKGEGMVNKVSMLIIGAFVVVTATTVVTTTVTGYGKRDKQLESSIRTEGDIKLILQAIGTINDDIKEIKASNTERDKRIRDNERPRKTSVNRGGLIDP